MDEAAHAFALELARREVQSCADIETLRALTLQVLDLQEAQRRWFLQTIADGWLNPAPTPLQRPAWPPESEAA